MNTSDCVPPLFDMEPPFPDMEGKKVCVTRGGKGNIGQFVVHWKPTERKFGLRLDITHLAEYYPRATPVSLNQWEENVGGIPVEHLMLSQDQIRRIVPSKNGACDFELNLD